MKNHRMQHSARNACDSRRDILPTPNSSVHNGNHFGESTFYAAAKALWKPQPHDSLLSRL